jgi:hypothetical protein
MGFDGAKQLLRDNTGFGSGARLPLQDWTAIQFILCAEY